MWKYNSHFLKSKNNPPWSVALWFPDDTKWSLADRDNKSLIFNMMNDCPEEWKYKSQTIKSDTIAEILNDTWIDCFIPGPLKNSHIRVYFQGMIVLIYTGLLSLKVKAAIK